jgi:ketosteroid isomerase-like protein
VRWLSPIWTVVHQQREAIGRDGERFTWTWLYASEFRRGRIASMTQFELDDEEAAFAYAEERSKESPESP